MLEVIPGYYSHKIVVKPDTKMSPFHMMEEPITTNEQYTIYESSELNSYSKNYSCHDEKSQRHQQQLPDDLPMYDLDDMKNSFPRGTISSSDFRDIEASQNTPDISPESEEEYNLFQTNQNIRNFGDKKQNFPGCRTRDTRPEPGEANYGLASSVAIVDEGKRCQIKTKNYSRSTEHAADSFNNHVSRTIEDTFSNDETKLSSANLELLDRCRSSAEQNNCQKKEDPEATRPSPLLFNDNNQESWQSSSIPNNHQPYYAGNHQNSEDTRPSSLFKNNNNEEWQSSQPRHNQPYYAGHHQNYASSQSSDVYPLPVAGVVSKQDPDYNAPIVSTKHDAEQGPQTWNQQQKYHYPPHYHHHQVPYYNNPHPGSYPYYNYDNHGARNGAPAYWNYWQQHQPPSGDAVNYHKRSFYEYESASSMHGDPTGGVHHPHTPVEVSPSYANRRPPAKKRSKKRPDDMPRYPLSAYNFFFSEEREVVLAVLSSSSAAAKKEARNIQNESSSNTSTGVGEEESSTAEQPDDEASSQYHNQEEEMEHIKNILSTHKIPEQPLEELQKKIKANTQRMLDTHLEGGKAKKSHKKTHGKITFQVLSKLIGQRWRSITDADVKQYYFDLAKADMERYKKQMKNYDTSRT